MKTGLSKLLLTTRFAGAPIVAVAAKPGGPEVAVLTSHAVVFPWRHIPMCYWYLKTVSMYRHV